MSIKPKNSYLKVTYNKAPFTTYPKLLATLLVQTFDIKKGDKLLDLGCGRGEFLRGFLDCGVEGYGIDQADSAKSLCPEATIVVGDLEKTLPFETNYFDVVYSKSVIEHFYFPERLVKEMYRILKPGGRIITMTPDWKYNSVSFYHDYTHRTPFTIESIRDIHEIEGFEEITASRFIQLPIFWKTKFVLPLIWLARWLFPDQMKNKSKFIRFSKELMLICSCVKPAKTEQ